MVAKVKQVFVEGVAIILSNAVAIREYFTKCSYTYPVKYSEFYAVFDMLLLGHSLKLAS